MPFRDPVVPTAPCPHCARGVEQGSEVCPHCRSPIAFDHYARMVLTLEPAQKRARRWLAICAGLQAFWVLVRYSQEDFSPRTLGQLSVGLFFAMAWLLARKWPLAAPLAVTGIFGMLEVAGIVLAGPRSLVVGILFKVFLLTALIRGVSAGYEIRNLRGEARPRDRARLIAFIAISVVMGILLGLALSARR